MPCAAIIVASGLSRRMGFDKLAAPIKDIPVLRRTVNTFMEAPGIDKVIVVCPQERFDTLLFGDFPKPLIRVDGGKERRHSVEAGLAVLDESDMMVAIHDGARPLVTVEMIQQTIEQARQCGAAALARPVTETIKKADHENFSLQGIDRTSLWYTETPQTFRTSTLKRAYAGLDEKGVLATDEVSVVESMGITTKLIHSKGPNLKITHPSDIQLAEALLS
ncbi:2-C-methyl-D-erythritol 4-phosphate cytidylyltransferase [Haloferula sp.]|uniref:2-C-methyl-D-erythritol 4-phosphate cytidylyltransferase n=1 Tax=Haloferula sp. TaxID=2497595 RepID=UPI003C781C62